jgi:tetratricopeptide (TPR) repeat protein
MMTTTVDPALRMLIGRAITHQQRGEFAEAEKLYQEALRMDPRQPDAQQFMGLLAHQTGRPDLALTHLRRALELVSGRADIHFNYANVLREQGRPQEAAQSFQHAVDIDPGMTAAWQGMGMVLHQLGFDLHAAAAYQQALQLDPGNAALWHAMGDCVQAGSLLPEAAEAYRRAQALEPAEPSHQLSIANVAMEARQEREAEAALERLLAMAPDMPEAHYTRGVWLANRGEFDAARTELKRALQLAPEYYQAALYYAYITPLPPHDPLVRRLQAAADKGGWREPAQGANVHFTLGYVLDKDGQYDAAFRHYLEANRLQRQLSQYSTSSQRELQASMQRAFGPEFLARARAFADPSVKPLFIVGMPRSGTSLLEQILSSHPLVHGGGEMVFLHAELRRQMGPSMQGDFALSALAIPDTEFAAMARGLVSHMDALAPQARHVTDKMPSNFMLLGLLHGLFPNARIIHCRRDPLDTCVSCFTTSFKSGHKFTNDLQELGEYYRLYEEAMAHWRQVLPAGLIHEVEYESLVGDLEPQVRALLAHCGLPWDEACLHFQDNARAVTTASVYQVRQPIYRSAIGRWRRYEKHLGPLRGALGLDA